MLKIKTKELKFSKKNLINSERNLDFSGVMSEYKEYPNGKEEFQKNIFHLLKVVSDKDREVWTYRYRDYSELQRMKLSWLS